MNSGIDSGASGGRPDPGSTGGAKPLDQCAHAVLMIRPAAFCWNPETAASNRFQRRDPVAPGSARNAAVTEFDGLVAALHGAGVEVHAIDEPAGTACPDCVFPNNWVSLHHDGTVVLYPMLAPSRRLERRTEILLELERRGCFAVSRLLDLSHHELSGRFLEGTGSVVFDHACRVAYACLSPRTNADVLAELCDELGYEPFAFDATDGEGVAVYHTNVLLSIGRRSAIVCAEAVPEEQRLPLLERLQSSGREVVAIDREQMAAFAGNALELAAADGTAVLALSDRAFRSLDARSLATLQRCAERIAAVPVPTIEDLGGGSVRCTLAEVFLPRRAAAT
jgi:hypothetical protein